MNKVTKKPSSFIDSREEHYWHDAQDIAFKAGCTIEIRGSDAFLVFEAAEECICQVDDFDRPSRNRPWFKIWTAVKARFPELWKSSRRFP